ncbi:MAG: hypothetical protein GX493_01540 [Firmicutes bacterium]|nr:hypothetical protein [Bacillota bacterium]
MELILDDVVVETRMLNVANKSLVEFAIPAEYISGPGRHEFSAAFSQGNARALKSCTFEYGADLPDLKVTEIEVGNELVQERYYPIKFHIEKARRLPVSAAQVHLYVETGVSRQLVGTVEIGPFGEGYQESVAAMLWDPGDILGIETLMAVINENNQISEFDTSNNMLTYTIYIPKIPMIEEIPALSDTRFILLNGTTESGTLVIIEDEKTQRGAARTDSSGRFSFEIWLNEGVNNLFCRVIDPNGRHGMATPIGTVIVDTLAPKITIHGVSNGMIVNHDITVSVEIEDRSSFEAISMLDGRAFSGSVTVISEGHHVIQVKAIDQLGHSTAMTCEFVIDKSPPSINVVGVAQNMWYKEDPAISVKITDATEIQKKVILDGGEFPGGTVSTEGWHVLAVEARDAAGNTNSVSIEFGLDKTPPTAEIILPAAGQEVIPGSMVRIEAADNVGLISGVLLIDGISFASFTTSPAEIPLNVLPGEYELKVKVVDPAGNEIWSTPVIITVISPDAIPPVTTASMQGTRWSDDAFKSPVTVTLAAEDDPGGTGVAGIYYCLDGGEERVYAGPFTVTGNGLHRLRFYAVDRAGNREAGQEIEIRILLPWMPAQTLLCRELLMNGNAKATEVFVDGPVTLKGNVTVEDLGTTAAAIAKTGNVKIGRLETNAPYRPLPVPDWEALRAATTLRDETRLAGNLTLADVRFAGDLTVSGNVKISGILLVEGDLTITGNLNLQEVAVFCRGEVRIAGNAKIAGLIYAGGGLKVSGNPEIKGVVVVDGRAEFAGNVKGLDGPPAEYAAWLRPGG